MNIKVGQCRWICQQCRWFTATITEIDTYLGTVTCKITFHEFLVDYASIGALVRDDDTLLRI